MEFNWYNVLGTVGVGLIIAAYFLLQTSRIESTDLKYSLLNGTGAVLVIISLYYDFNLPSFIVEFFWLLISIYGLIKGLISKKSG